MLRRYYFATPSADFKLRHYVGLSAVVAFLAWKLLRGISPDPITWYTHVYVLMALAGTSALTLAESGFRVRTFDMSLAVFIFCLVAIVRIMAFGTYRDSFTVGMLAFFGYFFLSSLFTRVTDREFFRGLSFVCFGLVIIEILGIVEHAFEWGIVDYEGMEQIAGVAPIEGVYGGQSFLAFFLDLGLVSRFWGRLSGVGGTPYATAGLMAAIAVFGLASRRWFLTVLAVIPLLLSSTGSAILALYVSAVVLYRRQPATWVILALLLPFLIWVFEHRGVTVETLRENYFYLWLESPGFGAIVATFIGEGRHAASLRSELRIFGQMFSLGLVGVVCLLYMLKGWILGIRLPADRAAQREFVAAGYFVFALFLSTLHYSTLFVFPNIAIVVAFLALISSRLRISRMADLCSASRIIV